MSNTGYKAYTNLEQYYLDNGSATGVTKTNSVSDPDYVAPVLDLVYCPLPSATPSVTPTISVTPSVTPTISITPSVTPTVTPSITPTISVTPSISVTPFVTPSISVTPSSTPSISVTPSITPSVTPSVSGGYAPNVTNVSAGVQPCIGGTCDDYLAWSITVDSPVLTATNYTLQIDLYQFGIYAYTYYAGGTIQAGQTFDYSDPCAGGGAYIGCNYTMNSVCVLYIDSPVNPSTYAC